MKERSFGLCAGYDRFRLEAKRLYWFRFVENLCALTNIVKWDFSEESERKCQGITLSTWIGVCLVFQFPDIHFVIKYI